MSLAYISGANLVNPDVLTDPVGPLTDVGILRHAFLQQALYCGLQQIVCVCSLTCQRQAEAPEAA